MTVLNNHLPLSGSFLGRQDDLAGVAGLLRDGPLVTLVGAPGVGKTRLALACASAQPDVYPGGVRFADLSRVTDPARIAAAVAAAPELRPPRAGTGVPEPALLVLDTCEHLIDACADLVGSLANLHPQLSILATSREPLSLQGEAAYRVPALRSDDAVQMFLDRAAARDCKVPDRMTPAVAEVCRGLDHIPLAVELAAIRATVLSPAQLAARLDDCLALLTEGSRTAPARHRSLRAALDWSHALLREPEQVLLRRLSIFAGDFLLEDAEQVCSGGPVRQDQVLGRLARLVATSLVECDPSGPDARYRLLGTVRRYAADHLAEAGEQDTTGLAHAQWCLSLLTAASGESRTDRTGPVRLAGYAADFTRAMDWSTAHAAAALRLDLAAAMSRFWLTSGLLERGRSHLRRLTGEAGRDRDTAAAAPVKSRPTGPAAPGTEPTARAWAHAMTRLGLLHCALGEFDDALAAGERALAEFHALDDDCGQRTAVTLLTGVRALVNPAEAVRLAAGSRAPHADGESVLPLAVTALAHAAAGDLPGAHEVARSCMAVADRRGDPPDRQLALLLLGHLAVLRCAYRDAERALVEALAIAEDRGDPLATALVLVNLGEAAAGRGQPERADELLGTAVALGHRTGSPAVLGYCLVARGWAALAAGEPDTASRAFAGTLALGERAAPRHVALGLLGLCEVALTTGQVDAAGLLAEEAVAMARRGGDRILAARSRYVLGRLAHRAGDQVRAWQAQHEALVAWADLGLPGQAADSLQACAALELRRERYDVAARLLGAAEALRARTDLVPGVQLAAEHAEQRAELDRRLPAGALSVAWREGAALSLPQVVAYAGRNRGPRGRAAGWAGLTRAEREVVLLAADGLTNREVAKRLLISPRTVQTHLSNVFAKLGVASRRDLAQEVTQRGQRLARYLAGRPEPTGQFGDSAG